MPLLLGPKSYFVAFFAVLITIWAVGQGHAQQSRSAPPRTSPCGAAAGSGALTEPPNVEVATLPLDDLGRHELIMRVRRDGGHFCFQYALDGVPQTVPPTLRMHRGERFALRLVNEISGPAPGATMKASALAPCKPAPMTDATVTTYSGYLNHVVYARTMQMQPLDVNLHLHGFEGPAQQENVFVSTLSTPAHACEYDITVPRTQPPGTYFYHPHAHGISGPEVGGGLSGMWIVEPDTAVLSAVDEHDILIRPHQPFTPYDAAEYQRETAEVDALDPVAGAYEAALHIVPALRVYDPFNPPPWPSYLPLTAGNQHFDPNGCGFIAEPLFSVNEAAAPATLIVPPGKPQLLRVLNALPNGLKYVRMRDGSGVPQTLHVVGRDGIPVSNDDARPLARYVPMAGILLAPAMRADILVTLRPGEKMVLYGDRHCVSPFGVDLLPHDLVTLSTSAAGERPPPAAIVSTSLMPANSRAAHLLQYVKSHPEIVHRRALTYTQYELPNANGKGVHLEFYLTDTSNRDFHEQPYWPSFAPGKSVPSHADIVVKQGTIEEWYLFNATPMDHTFHIHQMAFAAEDETPVPVMLDTVFVPPGRLFRNPANPNFPLLKPSRTRILLDFRHVPRGEFVYHCHLLLHEDNGMMGVVRVI